MPSPLYDGEVYTHLNGTFSDAVSDPDMLERDAADWVERYTGHILVARDVTEVFRVPPREIELRAWPIKPDAAVTVTCDGVPLPGVRVDVSRRPARLLPPIGGAWPVYRADQLLEVKVRAGYERSESDPIPGNLRRAMLVLAGAYDADREGGEIFQLAEQSARSLCREYRVRRV